MSQTCPWCRQPLPPEDPPKTWGEELRRARRDLRMTLGDVRRELGISHSWLSRIERGEMPPGAETRDRLIEFFGLSDPSEYGEREG